MLSVLTLVFGCAKQTKLPKPLLMNDFEPRWFKDKEARYQRFNNNGDLLSHRFFDAAADYSLRKGEVNFVVNTPSQSEFRYQTNLISGQSYLREAFCKGKDLVDSGMEVKKEFYLPNYHEGFIPQMLDQKLTPQRIIVFGADELIQSYYQESFFRARIIGAVLIKECSSQEHCLNNYNDRSEVVLIGVSKDDQKLKTVVDIEGLNGKVEWNKALTTLVNTEGVFFYKESFLPTVQSYQVVDADKAKELLKKNNKLFNVKMAESIRSNCHSIYKRIENIIAEQKRGVKIAKLKDLLGKESKSYSLCVNLVQAVDPRKDHQLHDFYNVLNLPYLLAINKNFYDCKKKKWQKATGLEKYSSINSLRRSIVKCNHQQFTALFETAFKYNESLQKEAKPYWRYIGYDDVSSGSHQRIDAWTRQPSEIIYCAKDFMNKLGSQQVIYPKKRSKDFLKIYNK